MIATHSSPYLSPRQDISVGLGNAIQALGFATGLALLLVQAQPGFVIAPDLGFLMAYLMIVFTSYASAQYGLGRLMGIRFSHYSVGSSSQRSGTFSFMHLAAHPDPRSWAQTGTLARGLFAISGALASTTLSLGMAALAANAGLWIGPVLVAANLLWFVVVIVRQVRHTAHLR